MKLSDEPREPGMVGFWDKLTHNTDDIGFFGIAQHLSIKEIEVNTVINAVDYLRCDATSRTGPHGLHEWDEVNNICNCGKSVKPHGLTGNHHIRFDNLAAIYPVIEAVPHGHIMYFELLTTEDELSALNEPHSDCARTLQEVFRLLLEWDWAYTELGNREKPAIVSHGIVETLEIPDSIKDWILNNIPDEKVARFIKGIENAQDRTSDVVPLLTDEFSEWLHSKISTTRSIGAYDADRSGKTSG